MNYDNAPPPWVVDQREIHVAKEMAKQMQQQVYERTLQSHLPPGTYRARTIDYPSPQLERTDMSTTAETLDATSSVFIVDGGTIDVGSQDFSNQMGHQIRIRVEGENGRTTLTMSPDLAERIGNAILHRSSEVRNARRR